MGLVLGLLLSAQRTERAQVIRITHQGESFEMFLEPNGNQIKLHFDAPRSFLIQRLDLAPIAPPKPREFDDL